VNNKALKVTLNDVLLIVGELELNYIVQGSELLLRPTDASTLVSELEKLGVTVIGFDGWHYPENNVNNSARLQQNLAIDFYVGDAVLKEENPVHRCAQKTKTYLETEIRNGTAFVSLTWLA